jgi:hypothetical protein
MRYNTEVEPEEYDESRISYGYREIYDHEGNKEKAACDKKKIRYSGRLRNFIEDYRDYIDEFYNN